MSTPTITPSPSNLPATFTFNRTAFVTKPFLIMAEGQTYVLKVLSRIKEESPEKASRRSKAEQKPMEIMTVFNYADSHQYRLVVFSVIGTELRDNYPNHTYVGKTFQIAQGEMRQGARGNKYKTFEILEGKVDGIDTPDAEVYNDAPVAAAVAPNGSVAASTESAPDVDPAKQPEQPAEKQPEQPSKPQVVPPAGKPAPKPGQQPARR